MKDVKCVLDYVSDRLHVLNGHTGETGPGGM